MTTIAYKDGVIAYDSYATRGEMVADHDANKKVVKNKVTFIFCGTHNDRDDLIDMYFGGKAVKDCEAMCFAVESGLVYRCGVNGDRVFWKERALHVDALGSGHEFAFGAMDAGASAYEAVKIACNRDIYSGGRVRIIKIK